MSIILKCLIIDLLQNYVNGLREHAFGLKLIYFPVVGHTIDIVSARNESRINSTTSITL